MGTAVAMMLSSPEPQNRSALWSQSTLRISANIHIQKMDICYVDAQLASGDIWRMWD
jgi:hypothetical protein